MWERNAILKCIHSLVFFSFVAVFLEYTLIVTLIHHSFSRSKYFYLLIAQIEGIITLLDNEIDRKIDVTAILFLLVQNRQQTHDWTLMDQALMDSAYMSEYNKGLMDSAYRSEYNKGLMDSAYRSEYNKGLMDSAYIY